MAVIGPPSVTHQGLIVPNAAQSASPRMAEPDQIDFATAANAMWGVVEGCRVTVSGTLAHMDAGTVVINGVLVPVRIGDVPLGFGQASDRFDLIAADTSGQIHLIGGEAAVDPVFPDVPMDCVLLAAVFCGGGAGPYTNNVIDKRRFVGKSLLTKLANDSKLIQNLNGSGDTYRVLGSGYTTWSEDTHAYRSAPKTLTIEENLAVPGNITAGGKVQANMLTATNLVSGSNLLVQGTQPATAPLGAIWQDTANGAIKIMTATGWKAIGFVADMVPPGTVIMSLESTDTMVAKGWLPFDGRQVEEDVYPNLFLIDSLLTKCVLTGTAPHRKMTLPDANGQVIKITKNASALLDTGGQSTIRVTAANMPAHTHSVSVGYDGGANPRGTIGADGQHWHNVDWTGPHTHKINDPGHSHFNGQYPYGNFVCLEWGGTSKTDALFNDRNHTYSVGSSPSTGTAYTGIKETLAEGSEHSHTMSDAPAHTHPLMMDAIPSHTHKVTEASVGGGTDIAIDPPYIALQAFIRT